MNIPTAIDAELAYRREQVTRHFRPWRRVGAERTTAQRRHGGPDHPVHPVNPAASSVIPLSQ